MQINRLLLVCRGSVLLAYGDNSMWRSLAKTTFSFGWAGRTTAPAFSFPRAVLLVGFRSLASTTSGAIGRHLLFTACV